MHAERRKFPRQKPDSRLVCSCTNEQFPAQGRNFYNLAMRLVDVSPRGACLVTVGRLREQAALIVDIFAPQDLARFKARATVRWSTTLERGGRTAHVAGIRFERVLESYGERLSFLGGRGAASSPARTHEPQRRYKRFRPADVRVVCNPRDFWRSLGIRTNPALGVHDLSLGGAQIVCSKRLKPGRYVDLTLEADRPRATVQAEAQVRWCRRDTRSLESRWLAGLVFQRMSPTHEEALKELDHHYLG
jgi:PilZ domain-containing protein